jgi:hypothetical protein
MLSLRTRRRRALGGCLSTLVVEVGICRSPQASHARICCGLMCGVGYARVDSTQCGAAPSQPVVHTEPWPRHLPFRAVYQPRSWQYLSCQILSLVPHHLCRYSSSFHFKILSIAIETFAIMRLLRLGTDGYFSQYEFTGKAIPRYAILSHTWGEDDQEVTFEDIRTGSMKHKTGYHKLHFCAMQAAADSLDYFWVDTCCIDKSSSTELQEAINSMFAWYRDAARCYAYLADVSTEGLDDSHTASESPYHENWAMSFRKSKWFTRGWTLQELLAPVSVEFFSMDGRRLGDKLSLCQDIVEATGIPSEALQGGHGSLFQFSVNERLSWAAGRETKREEDAAYSILGLLDLAIPLIYGEGRERAFRRLHREREIASAYERELIERNDGHDRGFDALVGDRKGLLKRTASQAFDSGPEDYARGISQESEVVEEDTVERRTELMQTW